VQILVQVLRLARFESRAALCKVGSIDKTVIGIAENLKVECGFEASCNPVLQARLRNREEAQVNGVMGLCFGHDSLFTRHSDAPVATLVVKDRLSGHNPVAGLCTIKSDSARMSGAERLRDLQAAHVSPRYGASGGQTPTAAGRGAR
jgi:uncharacterized metal-binding protein